MSSLSSLIFVLQSTLCLGEFQPRSRIIESTYEDNRNFRLLCPRDSRVTAFESVFTAHNRMNHRIFKLRCSELPASILEAKCYNTKLSPPMKRFELLCDPRSYMVGLQAVPHGRKDMRFKLHCCESEQVTFSWCTIDRPNSIYGRQNITLTRKDMFFTGFTSEYSLEDEDREFAMHQCAYAPYLFPDQVPSPPIRMFVPVPVPMAYPMMPPMPMQQVPMRFPVQTAMTKADMLNNNNNNNNRGSSFNDFTDDFDIIVVPSSKSSLHGTSAGRKFSPLEGETRPFENFDIHCPARQALKALSIRRVINENSEEDLAFVLDCRAVPLSFLPDTGRGRKADFIIGDDNSEQSPCVFASNEFLCGLLGTYERQRRLSAYCCFIDDLQVQKSQLPIANVPTLSGIIFQADSSRNHFVGNMDKLNDGSFVAYFFEFKSAL